MIALIIIPMGMEAKKKSKNEIKEEVKKKD